jgi:hypothetical protein
MLRCPCCGHDRFRLSMEPPGDALDGFTLHCGSCARLTGSSRIELCLVCATELPEVTLHERSEPGRA